MNLIIYGVVALIERIDIYEVSMKNMISLFKQPFKKKGNVIGFLGFTFTSIGIISTFISLLTLIITIFNVKCLNHFQSLSDFALVSLFLGMYCLNTYTSNEKQNKEK